MKSYILAALACAIANAHVRMRYTSASIRNAATPNADGKFSVKGPCGGAEKYDMNGNTVVLEGSELELSIAYNGGHKSATKNFFSVAYVCGKVDKFPNVFDGGAVKGNAKLSKAFQDAKGVLLKADQIVAPTLYPVDATTSATSGYKIKFKVPKIEDLDTNARKCTFSLVEYRNWGGCVDLSIKAAAPGTTTPPGPPPSLSAVSLAQRYDITAIDFDMDLATNGDTCGDGPCTCGTANVDKKCFATNDDDRCVLCQYKGPTGYKDNCLCSANPGVPGTIRHYGTCTRDSPKCLCMEGLITVRHQTSQVQGALDVNVRAMEPLKPDRVWSLATMVPLTQDGKALATATPVTVELKSGEERLTQQIMVKSTPAAKNSDQEKRVHLSLTVVDDDPKICSFEATIVQDADEVARQDKGKPYTGAVPERDPPKAPIRAASSSTVAALGYLACVLTGVLQ